MNMKKIYLSVYRLIGFGFLVSLATIILYYAVLMIFFLINTSWVAPTVLSATSDRMIAFTSGYQQAVQSYQSLKAASAQAKREAAVARDNIKQLSILKEGLQGYEQQTKGFASLKQRELQDSKILATRLDTFKKESEDSLKAGLITRSDLAQLLTFIQNFGNGITDASMNLGATRIAATSQLTQIDRQIAQAESEEKTKEEAYASAEISLAVAEKVLANLDHSSYKRAMGGGAYLAFIPYDNLKSVKVGSPVYDCYLLIIACHQVGEIDAIFEDEQVVDYPIFNVRFSRTVRGVFASMKMTSRESMSSAIFFSGGKPLFF